MIKNLLGVILAIAMLALLGCGEQKKAAEPNLLHHLIVGNIISHVKYIVRPNSMFLRISKHYLQLVPYFHKYIVNA